MDDIEDIAGLSSRRRAISARPLRACYSASVLRIETLTLPVLFVGEIIYTIRNFFCAQPVSIAAICLVMRAS
jgi:hypothetical protein